MSPEYNRPYIESLVGKTITINPQQLLNKGLLFSKQDYIETERAVRAIKSQSELSIAKAGISLEKIHGRESIVYTILDGNHRVGLACLRSEEINVLIEGIWIGNQRWGFNKIKQQLAILMGNNLPQ